MRFGKNPNQPETDVNLRQHVIHTDTDGCAMKTGEERDRTDPWNFVEDGYRVIARRPWSEIFNESIDPDRAEAIEDFAGALTPPDRW